MDTILISALILAMISAATSTFIDSVVPLLVGAASMGIVVAILFIERIDKCP